MRVLLKEHWILWNIQIITLGRSICIARSPKCGEVSLEKNCPGGGGKKGNNVRKFRIMWRKQELKMEETAHIIKVETSRRGTAQGKRESRFIRGNRFRDNRAGSEAR